MAIYVPACRACDSISPLALVVDGQLGDYQMVDDPWLGAHDGHPLELLTTDEAEATIPRPGWAPRPAYGPPLPGHAQDVVCPLCSAVGGSGGRDPVVWKRTEAGDPFVFCRACGYTWGPGADAERGRMLLRSLGDGHG